MKKSFTEKLWIVMKIGATQLILALTLCGISMAHSNFAQLLDKKISINLVEVPFEKALKEIEKTANIRFAYSTDQLRIEGEVTLSTKNQALREVLSELLESRQITYKVHQKTATITLKKLNEENHTTLSFKSEDFNKSEIKKLALVSGQVTDASSGLPLAGVNIIVKGTTNGTTTDVEGKYNLKVEEKEVLVFSFIGYTSVEVIVGKQSVIVIALEQDTKSLQEVVINAGYWQLKDREQTGNISRLSAQEIDKQPANNPLQALQGKMAGVFIQQNSGVPGGSFNIQIRGQNSLRSGNLNNGNRPLYIVDGVPFTSEPLGTPNSGAIIDGGNPLNNINPADIESVEILKDADATAIYGSRGANGVVLITTKKGKAGRTQFNVNFYEGAGKVASKLELMNTAQYLEMRNEALANDDVSPGTFFPDHDLLTWDQNRYTDWQKTLLGGTANVRNAQLSASGGSADTQFLIAAGYFSESTVFPGSFKDEKVSANFKINHRSPSNKWKLDFSAYYVIDNNKLPRIDLTSQALLLPPNAPALYKPDGTLNWENSTWDNPLAALHQEFSARTTSLVNNTVITYQIAPAWQAKMNLGYSEIRFNEFTSQPKASFDPAKAFAASSTFANKRSNTWITEPQLEYRIGKGDGVFTALVGATFQENDVKAEAINATGFSSDALLHNLQAASELSISATEAEQYRYTAFFGRMNYNWRGKYLVNLTGRRDGSSRFGPGKQFANFGAAGVAWIFTEEKFIHLPLLSFGKFRASYGTTGSDQIGNYGYLDLWNSSGFAYDGITGLAPTNLANSDYAWEVNKKMEAGVELGFWKDKLNLSVSYYKNTADNQLVGVPLPSIVGFASVQANFPAEVRNTGLEINLNTAIVKSEGVSWSTNFNLTLPRNRLVAFPDLANSSFAYDYVLGKPLGFRPVFHHLGVDPQTGLYLHEDVQMDGQLTPDDFRGLKGVEQKYFGGFQNTITYKQISLDIFFQFVKQTGRNYWSYSDQRPGSASNQPLMALNRWQKPGDLVPVQKYTQGFGEAFLANLYDGFSDNTIGDASYIRLRSISLSYNFPARWISQAGMQKARMFVQGQNLLTFTNYDGLDPETQSASLPPLRKMTVGVSLTF